jgi:hypothetical protein
MAERLTAEVASSPLQKGGASMANAENVELLTNVALLRIFAFLNRFDEESSFAELWVLVARG